MDDTQSNNGSDVEEEQFHYVKKKFTVFIIDATEGMQNTNHGNLVKGCIEDMYNIFSCLKTHKFFRNIHTAVITLGLIQDVDILCNIHSDDISKLKEIVDKKIYDKCVNNKLMLKEGIETAVEILNRVTKKDDIKTIVFVTNNPTPKFHDEDDAMLGARLLNMNSIEFAILPAIRDYYESLTESRFYKLFFEQLAENSCELLVPECSFFDFVCNRLQTFDFSKKICVYLTEDVWVEVVEQTLFRSKKPVRKVIAPDEQQTSELNDVKVKDDALDTEGVLGSFDIVDESPKCFRINYGEKTLTAEFSGAEHKELTEKGFEPKKNGLYLLYIADEPKNPIPCVDDVKVYILKANLYKPHQIFFNYLWSHCVKTKKVAYCILFNKKRNTVILKPILYHNKPCFIKYGIGYYNNYVEDESEPEEYEELDDQDMDGVDIMESIVYRLKNTNKHFLDFRDPASESHDALYKAKLEETPVIVPDDKLSMASHTVDEIIGNLSESFNDCL